MVIHVIGNDPGSVNFTICEITLDGMTYSEDYTEVTPRVVIHNWEVWNLKTLWGIRRKRGTSQYEKYNLARREQAANPFIKGGDDERDNIAQWLINMNHFILHNTWIREDRTGSPNNNQLPTLAVEVQLDHIKNHSVRADMHTISNSFASSVYQNDLVHAHQEMTSNAEVLTDPRLIIRRAVKYGLPHNGSIGDHDDRKVEAIKVAFNLLKKLGLHEWVGFLETVKKSGQKIDDLADSFLLALQTAIDLYTEKKENTLPDNIPQPQKTTQKRSAEEAFFSDEIAVVDMPLKKPRKTPVPKKLKPTAAAASTKAQIENEESIKRRELNLTFREMGEDEGDDDDVIIIDNNKKKKKSPSTKKRKQSPKKSDSDPNKKFKLVPLSVEIVG